MSNKSDEVSMRSVNPNVMATPKDMFPPINHQVEVDMSAIEMRLWASKMRAGLWKPISDHPKVWYDGDAYILKFRVRSKSYKDFKNPDKCVEYNEYHIVSASCDSETPTTFKDSYGETFDAWHWDDAVAYIRLSDLSETKGESDD